VAGQYPLFDHQRRACREVYELLCGQPPACFYTCQLVQARLGPR
jgi:hypothetical protein